jgi:acyl-CoA synthetase (AMP-forming)/AMP-acid ligase II
MPLTAPAAAAVTLTLWDIVRRRAASDADGAAYTFLTDGAADARSITWSQLARRATALGESLRQQGATGQPVLLALPSGLAFVEWLFACWHAGAIIVPVSLPRHQRVKRRLEAIVADAGARFAIASAATRQRLQLDPSDAPSFAGLHWIDADAVADPISESNCAPPPAQRVALLQYTSGSTGTPRGVIVTHDNLVYNSALISEASELRAGDTIAGWLPLFHDMGLIGFVLQAAYSGARCVFMAPERFLMRPWLWLQMMSDYGACCSAAPNFAYDLCVEKISAAQKATLDLRHWRNALNGSEAVRAATLERFAAAFAPCGFRSEAFFPCYGLAEATLFAAGPAAPRRRSSRRRADGTVLAASEAGGHVSCGRPFGDTQIAIVDPKSDIRVSPGAIGEIWLAGRSIAEGYWKNPQATAAAFNARIAATSESDGDGRWLRSGDLGFIADGELFITGRLRELIIVAGRNHFPADIESTVESADAAIASSGAVAFSIEREGTERLIVAAEVRREYRQAGAPGAARALDPAAICQRIRAAVVAYNEVMPFEVTLLRPGAVPRTSSGKISRVATRAAYLSGTLEILENIADVRRVI